MEGFFLVDPLDGTKEFINRNDKFTVNIALIKNQSPFCGVIYVLVTGETYYGGVNEGSYKILGGKKNRIYVSNSKSSDELPQLINVLKGEMKIIGVRPLSQVRYNEFPNDLKNERIKYKPGCIPPYVSLGMSDEKGNIEAERIYLKDKSKHPFLTDVKYFYLAIYSILIKRMRSA